MYKLSFTLSIILQNCGNVNIFSVCHPRQVSQFYDFLVLPIAINNQYRLSKGLSVNWQIMLIYIYICVCMYMYMYICTCICIRICVCRVFVILSDLSGCISKFAGWAIKKIC